MSCDLLPTERPGPHYEGDVRDVLDDGWTIIVAHSRLADDSPYPGHAILPSTIEAQEQRAGRSCASSDRCAPSRRICEHREPGAR